MRIRYGWELALAALLVIEIVAFGAINPRKNKCVQPACG